MAFSAQNVILYFIYLLRLHFATKRIQVILKATLVQYTYENQQCLIILNHKLNNFSNKVTSGKLSL